MRKIRTLAVLGMRCEAAVAAMGLILAAVSSASALTVDTWIEDSAYVEGFYLEGDAVEIGSWSQPFSFRINNANICQIQLWIEASSGQSFDSPGFSLLPNPGWTEAGNTGEYLWTTGTGYTETVTNPNGKVLAYLYATTLNFFAGTPTSGPEFILHVQLYDSTGTQLGNGDWLWHQYQHNNWKWSPEDHTQLSSGTWTASSPLPEPVTMAGLVLGVGCVGGYLRRRRLA